VPVRLIIYGIAYGAMIVVVPRGRFLTAKIFVALSVTD